MRLMSHSLNMPSSFVLLYTIIISIPLVKNSIYQIRFANQSDDAVCIYFSNSIIIPNINTFEVKFNIARESSPCHWNNPIEKLDHHTKEILILPLAFQCPLIEQLTILKNSSWIEDYFAVIFSIHRNDQTFEQTLLSYFSHQIEPSLQSSFHSIPSDYHFNQTIIGFIESTTIHRLNHSNLFFDHLQREKFRYDPAIFLVVGLMIICMLIGNEYHQRIFLRKLHEHDHSSQTTKYQLGFLIGFLLFLAFVICYLLDRYLTNIIGEIYFFSFLILSTVVIYFVLKNLSYLLINQFQFNDLEYFHQWCRLILKFISFLLMVVWFLNRLTCIGLIFTNGIVFFLTVFIIIQMRVVNLMICLIVFTFIILFECSMLMVNHWQDESIKKLIIVNPEFPMGNWTVSEEKNGSYAKLIYRMYMNMLDNSGFDWWLSGGSLNIFKINAINWIIRENLPLILTFPRLMKDHDSCAFHTGRIYLSIDDMIFPSLLINFCRLFDIGNNIPFRIYYIQALLSYVISIFLSFLIMITMKYDQWLSICIYPIMMVSTILTGLIRGEFRKLLRGTLTTLEERPKKERSNSF